MNNNNEQKLEVNENNNDNCNCGQDQFESNLKTHAELGNQLDLFFFDDKSPGSAFFLPAGAILYNNLLSYFRSEYIARGYQEVLTPNIFDKSLWETSGHWDKYKENMFIIEKHHPDDVSQFSLKPMNCIVGDSNISLSNCTSVKMNKMDQSINDNLIGYDDTKKELVNTKKINFIKSGKKECIELMFLDGRKLVCTPEHRILTTNGWIEAQNLVIKESEILCGPSFPLVSQEINEDWKLIFKTETDKTKETKEFSFNMRTQENIAKSLAFARLCGIIITDGTIGKDNKNIYHCEIYTGHNIDLRNIMADIKLVFGDMYNNTFGKKRNLWRVTIPSRIARLFADLFGYGGRMDKDTSLPLFLFDDNLPVDFLRQFLSGVFGGDGWAPVLSGNCFTEVYIALSKSEDKLNNLLSYMKDLALLLKKAGIENTNITGPYKNQKGTKHHYRIKIESSSLLDFAKYIGFAYCCHKSTRLSVVQSYYMLKKEVIDQHNNFKNKFVDQYCETNKENRELYSKLKEETIKNEYIFNDKFSIPEIKYLQNSIKTGSKLSHIGGYGFYTPVEYLKEIDGEKFFNPKSYAVEIEHELPTFKLKLLTCKNVGIKKVYDVSVDTKIQSFVANGIIVHNCPSHCLMFKHMNPSYKQLPMRLADFGVLHRNEFHGALRGLTRVRKFSQDDAHIFCSMDQIEDEIKGVIDFIKQVYKIFNFKFSVGLSTKPEKYIGSLDNWNKAEEILSRLITTFEESNINQGDGAFYGPKLDFTVTDTLGRKHQLGTIQLDFNLPERFNLTYQDDQGELIRPVIIHRAILGSVERFIALLLENAQGDIPYFVSPRQVCIIPVSVKPDLVEYCNKVKNQILSMGAGKYVNVDLSSETLQKKILNAEVLHYNFIIVLGKKELGSSTVNIRGIGEKSHDYLIKMLLDESENENNI
jgi:threonyl-tRNA synthetase